MAYLAILQPDQRVEARLLRALSGTHRVVVVTSWPALRRVIAKETLDGCVVDADCPTRDEAMGQLRWLRARRPHLALVVHADVDERDLTLYRFGELGVDGVLLASASARGPVVRDGLDRALASALSARIQERVAERCGNEGARAVGWTVENAESSATVVSFAGALGHTPRSLGKLLRDARMPSASRLLTWGRLLLAGAYLGRDGRTVEETAYALGYSTASALGRAMKRETGANPREVSLEGGADFVLERLCPERRRGAGKGLKALVLLLAAVQAGCASLGLGGPTVDRGRIDRTLDTPPVHQVHFGVYAVEAVSSKPLYARNAHRKFVPASNQKILVTATALSLLGPEYRFETALWASGPVRAGTLDGDLVLIATGDPTLSHRYWDSGEAALRALADSLHHAGVHRVTGSLVVDASAWDSTSVGPTWEVEDLRYAYGATGGAFALDQGEIRLFVSGSATPGQPAGYDWSPRGRDGWLDGRLVTAPADSSTRVRPSYHPESRRILLDGRVAVGATDTLAFAARDPVRLATETLARILAEGGIDVAGGASVAWNEGRLVGGGCRTGSVDACEHASRLAGLRSPPLDSIVAGILKPSQNWMSEQLLRTLGAEIGERGSWPEGVAVVRRFLTEEIGVDSLDLAPRDGSGLSAYNLVTPRALVQVLQYMAGGPHAETYRYALAEPGQEGSTLSNRLAGLEGRVFAKTGSISNVNSLSGYLVQRDGTEVIFSILSNGSGLPANLVRSTIDDVVRQLAGMNP